MIPELPNIAASRYRRMRRSALYPWAEAVVTVIGIVVVGLVAYWVAL